MKFLLYNSKYWAKENSLSVQPTSYIQNLTFNFRLATHRNIYQYFFWTNDPGTRKQSFNSKRISFAEHCKWFNYQMENKETVMIIMYSGKQNIGQIRFQLKDNIAKINYSLDNKFRGNGLATKLITGGIKHLLTLKPDIQQIEGFVKLNNYPSIKTFRRIGFEECLLLKHNNTIKFKIDQPKNLS